MKKTSIILLTFLLGGYCYAALAADTSGASIAQKMQQLQRVATEVKQGKTVTTPQQQSNSTLGSQVQPAVSTKSSRGNMSNRAFAGVIQNRLPMTPEQIANLRKAFNQAQKAASTPTGTPPRPTTSSVLVNLAPQAAPPVIRLGAGYITSLVFVDATGQPWPIAAYSVGDPTSYNIQWDRKSNTIMVQSDTFYRRSNLAVQLKGLDTPVMLTLMPGQKAVDYRVDLRVPSLGPNAVLQRGALPNAGDPVMLSVLNGIPPKQAKTLRVVGDSSAQAWLLNNKLYLRTHLLIISPAWQTIMTSIDGTHAYQLQPASVILALQHGKNKTLKLVLEGLD